MSMANNEKAFELIGTYTVPTSWENDTDGIPPQIIQTILAPYVGGDAFELYCLDFVNNNASNQNYKGDVIYFGNIGAMPTNVNTFAERGTCVRNNYSTVKQLSKSTSFWVSSGTLVNIYKLKY